MCPPPRRIPLRFEPARALPVPFWRYIFLVEPETMPRDFVWCEPWRTLAWYITTASCNSCLLMRGAKSVGSTLYVPTFFPLRSYIVSLGMVVFQLNFLVAKATSPSHEIVRYFFFLSS